MEYCYVDSRIGRIKGAVYQEGKLFSNIPYAHTPRFRDPIPYEYLGEYDATGRSMNCFQRFTYVDESKEENNFYYGEFDYMRDSDYNEDYITLNITTPLNKEKCPVIVYLHGGSFENGCINDEPFGTSFEYAKRGVILVVLGYRLNVFGLYDSQNYGLRDQLFGLKWVKEYISDFGGDPDNITLMGQSAGAFCASLLLKDKEDVQGLIKGAVLMSGIHNIPDVIGPREQSVNKEFWDKVMARAGCKNQEELEKVDAKKLWESWYQTKQTEGNSHISLPSVDGKIVKDRPVRIAKKNLDADVPIIMGVTSQDMFPYLIYETALSAAKLHSKNKDSKVYCYFFDRTPPGNHYRAFHACDLWYMFGNMQKSWRQFEEIDYQISKTMIDYVANFAFNHDPNDGKLPKWEPIDKKNSRFRWFSENKETTIGVWKCRKKMAYTTLIDKGPF